MKFLSLTNGPMKLGKPHCIYKSENMHTNLRNLISFPAFPFCNALTHCKIPLHPQQFKAWVSRFLLSTLIPCLQKLSVWFWFYENQSKSASGRFVTPLTCITIGSNSYITLRILQTLLFRPKLCWYTELHFQRGYSWNNSNILRKSGLIVCSE